ncbi:hypothetical protein O998_03590 [Anaplasma phagocytophilum str. Norway variant1]|uniref:Uncharacterized protein n=1 Tax=Anaplasma phagocytophilum str. Norway variant1 TaxID=1392506 RepID=A0A7H9DZD8_ANAPH|nr:hypothetical protein [Anaplasma phagocytophilum]QLL66857.1 hypothetical protein O998_03590 [Anaplasma phagocytophilum str. Norway variant1]
MISKREVHVCGVVFFEFWKKSIVARLHTAHVSTKAVVRILERYHIRATREHMPVKLLV